MKRRRPARARAIASRSTAQREPFEATALGLAGGGGLAVRRDDGTSEIVALADARVLRLTG